jgi:hypothetical protein
MLSKTGERSVSGLWDLIGRLVAAKMVQKQLVRSAGYQIIWFRLSGDGLGF